MADMTPDDMAAKLLASGFERSSPSAAALTDPIADTPMVVTLDQLRPYDHDPRVTRNPAYEDIKASIRERGLDAPPAITRRPGEPHYIIRNGGNTRLAILRELWSETKNERFLRIPCLFRPWRRCLSAPERCWAGQTVPAAAPGASASGSGSRRGRQCPWRLSGDQPCPHRTRSTRP